MEIFRTLRLQVCIIFSKSAPRLPVFDRMSADSFDQLINKAMPHFLSPFLSSLQRAKFSMRRCWSARQEASAAAICAVDRSLRVAF